MNSQRKRPARKAVLKINLVKGISTKKLAVALQQIESGIRQVRRLVCAKDAL